MCAYGKFFGQFTVSEDFDSSGAAIGEANGSQRRFIHAGAIVKLVQLADIDRDKLVSKSGVVESALRNTADQRHLAAFKANADRTA